MSHEIIDQVTRFVTRFDAVQDPATMEKVKEEGKDYDFRKISTDIYAVIHDGKMYIIIEKDGKFGCSCEDMSYRRTDGTICKHLIRFSLLMSSPTKPLDDADITILKMMGWTGEELHPPDVQVTPDDGGEDVPDSPVPPGESKPERIPSKCKWCGLGHEAPSQVEADVWLEGHEKGCPKNPANEAKTNSPDKRPKESKGTEAEQESTAVVPRPELDEREYTNARVRRYVENRGGFYKNQRGQEVPDSAAMSLYALDSCRISTETILIEKDADQAKAIVRGFKGDVSVDASVILRFDVLKRREVIKMAKKYPQAILEWTEQMMPILNLNFTLKDRTPVVTLGEHMINFTLDQEQFADRTAETLARRRVFDMLTGVDWRDEVEIAIEDADASSMGGVKR